MGNFCSPRKSEQLKAELLSEAKLNPQFEAALRSKLFSNHADKIINEFEKFLLLQAIKASESPAGNFKPLLASPIIDQVWRHAILYTKYYTDHSQQLVGRFGLGFIHRIDPRTLEPKEAYDAYNETLRMYDVHIGRNFRKGEARSLPMLLWPEYSSPDEMQLDLNLYVWINDEKKAQLKKAAIESLHKDSQKQIDPKKLAADLATGPPAQSPSEVVTLKIPADPRVNMERVEGLQLKYAQLMNGSQLPPKFMEILMNEQMISASLAKEWIAEYKKYLLMCYISNESVSPSREVDEVWHLHQHFTEEYAKFCQEMFGCLLAHAPSAHDGSEKEDFMALYNKTLDFYSKLFGEIPRHIWPEAAVRFGPANRNWVNLNKFVEAVVMLEKLPVN